MHVQGIADRHYFVKVIELEKPTVLRRKPMMEHLTSEGRKVIVGLGVASCTPGAFFEHDLGHVAAGALAYKLSK